MESNSETFVTSRSRTPSIIEVTSQDDHVFSNLPDYIQEAAVSLECKFIDIIRKMVTEIPQFLVLICGSIGSTILKSLTPNS
jgi:hypothetical protein